MQGTGRPVMGRGVAVGPEGGGVEPWNDGINIRVSTALVGVSI